MATPEHLDGRHRDTLRQIFEHPTSHNIEWRSVADLLETVGTVTVRHDGKVAVKLGNELEFLDPPAGKDIDFNPLDAKEKRDQGREQWKKLVDNMIEKGDLPPKHPAR